MRPLFITLPEIDNPTSTFDVRIDHISVIGSAKRASIMMLSGQRLDTNISNKQIHALIDEVAGL